MIAKVAHHTAARVGVDGRLLLRRVRAVEAVRLLTRGQPVGVRAVARAARALVHVLHAAGVAPARLARAVERAQRHAARVVGARGGVFGVAWLAERVLARLACRNATQGTTPVVRQANPALLV